MATSKAIEAQSKTAEIHRGQAACKEKFLELLENFSVPRCLFQMADIEAAELEEFGFNRSTGFFWLRQKAKTERKIHKIGTIYFDVEVAGYIEQRRMWKLTGVKGKEMMVTLPLCEILVGYPSADKVKCLSTAGVYRVRLIADFLNTK